MYYAFSGTVEAFREWIKELAEKEKALHRAIAFAHFYKK